MKGLMVAMVAYGESHPAIENARLIAAAPELYEALEQLASVPKPHPHPLFEGQRLLLGVELDQALDRASAALTKARGEA